jgi:negative regulator of flagellin synthesis FlgM
MKINDQQKLLELYAQTQATQNQQQNRAAEAGSQAPAQGDRVQISNGSKFLQKVNEAMKAEDPQRAERLQMIKEQVQNGTYEVDPEKVANAMMKDLLKDLG